MTRFVPICLFFVLFGRSFGAIPTGKITFADDSELTIQEPVPVLPAIELTDSCVIGTFMTYDVDNFEMDGVRMTYWYYPPNDTGLYCWGDMFFEWRSARPIAHQVDTLTPFASLYAGESIQFEEVVITSELANVEIPIGSIYLRLTSLELFSEPDFGGDSFCVLDCGGLICEYSSMLEIPGEITWDITNAKSAKLGCAVPEKSVMSTRLGDSTNSDFGYHIHSK